MTLRREGVNWYRGAPTTMELPSTMTRSGPGMLHLPTLLAVCFALQAVGCLGSDDGEPESDAEDGGVTVVDPVAGEHLDVEPEAGAADLPELEETEVALDVGPEPEVTEDAACELPEPPVEPETIFRDATEELGLAGLKSSSISVADIDGDGFDDLLVGGNLAVAGTPTEVYRYTDNGTFEPVGLAGRVSGATLMHDISSTTVADLNNDGLPELVLGSYYLGAFQVLWNRGDLQFDVADVFESEFHAGTKVTGFEAWDFNGDGFVDLFASMKLPSAKYNPFSKTHDNILFINEGIETFASTRATLDDTLLCGRKQTFGSYVMPRAAFGLNDVLFVANDMTGDCAWELPGGFPIPDFVPVADPEALVSEFSFSMGGDYLYEDDTGAVVMFTTLVGIHRALRFTSEGVEAAEELQLDHGAAFFGWGLALFDADNDGDQDAVVASGVVSSNEDVTLFSAQVTPYDDPVLSSKIHYFERKDGGAFEVESELAGPGFEAESGEWHSVTRGDFDRDGCIDVIVGVRQLFGGENFWTHAGKPYDPAADTYSVPTEGLRVFMNNCKPSKNRWVGLRVPDVPGILVALERSDGHTVYDVVKGTVGIGSRSGGGLLHFGLGESLEVVGATVYGPSGAVMATLGPLAAGAYHPLP